MLRQHESVLAEGTFRIVLTDKHRILAMLDAPHTMLGPLHLMVEIDRGLRHPRVIDFHNSHLLPAHAVGFSFSDIGDAIGHAAESTFNAASKVATTLARPVFNVAKHAASAGAHLIAHATPFLPEATRRKIDAGARIMLRARLGDVTAKQFIRNVVNAAKAGVHAARAIGDSLVSGARLLARTIDIPVHLLEHVPGIGGFVKSISPLQKFDKMMGNLQRGDFKSLERMVHDDLSMAQGIVSLIPGIGTGISAGISAGLAALDGGSPLEVALRTAYGAIPIPIGIRQITDAVLGGVLALLFHPGKLTDIAVAAARDAVPSGFPRDVFDTLVQLVVKRVPIQKVALGLADHYVSQYAGPAVAHLGDLVTHAAPVADLVKHAQHLSHIADGATHATHFSHLADGAKHPHHHFAYLAEEAKHAAHLAELTKQMHRFAHVAEQLPHDEMVRLLRPMHLMPA
jgi:hypothetical protein